METLWLIIGTDYNHLTIQVVYQPPGADNMIVHINSAIDYLRAKHPFSGLIVTGDFNQLPTQRFTVNGPLKQLVKDPIRGSAILDKSSPTWTLCILKQLLVPQSTHLTTELCLVGHASHLQNDRGHRQTVQKRVTGPKGEGNVCYDFAKYFLAKLI